MLVGLLAAPSVSPIAAVLFVVGAVSAFLVRAPLQALLAKPSDRRAMGWLALYAAMTAGAFLPLILVLGCWKLLFFGAPAGLLLAENLTANESGRRFSAFNEGAGVLGLCLGAPAAYYSASFALDARAWSLWILCSAFFLGPIFYVKMAALQHRAFSDPAVCPALALMRRRSAAYHGLVLAAVSCGAAFGGLSPLAVIPFAAAFIKTVIRGAHAPERVNFRSLGYAEVAYSILFVLAAGVTFAA
jgi:hypothetical protein